MERGRQGSLKNRGLVKTNSNTAWEDDWDFYMEFELEYDYN